MNRAGKDAIILLIISIYLTILGAVLSYAPDPKDQIVAQILLAVSLVGYMITVVLLRISDLKSPTVPEPPRALPKWEDAPEWANYLVQNTNGSLLWFESRPYDNKSLTGRCQEAELMPQALCETRPGYKNEI